MVALTRLAALTNATSDTGKIIALAENLEGMSARTMARVFAELEKTWKFAVLPEPAAFWEAAERLSQQPSQEDRFEPCRQNGCADGFVIRTALEDARPVKRAYRCECFLKWKEGK